MDAAIGQTRGFLDVMIHEVLATQEAEGTPREAFERCHAKLAPRYGRLLIMRCKALRRVNLDPPRVGSITAAALVPLHHEYKCTI